MRWILALVTIAVGAGSVGAQPNDAKPAPAGPTRIAVVDVGRVFRGISWGRLRERGRVGDAKLDALRAQSQKLSDEIKAWKETMDDRNTPVEHKVAYKAAIEKNGNDFEAVAKNLEQRRAKVSEELLVELWTDIRAAVREYAIEHKIDLVLAYGDPAEKEMIDQPANIQRKKDAIDVGGTVPLFVAPGADITDGVLEILNARPHTKTKQ